MINKYHGVCFTRGGYGAPAAVDALETMLALGVRRIFIAGLCGAFDESFQIGDVIIPSKVLSEEGVSHHYFADIEYAVPNTRMHENAMSFFQNRHITHMNPTVTIDAVYRETLFKESYWRSLGCVGVEMETSALLAVSKYYKVPAVAMLLVSDKHPVSADDEPWSWGLSKKPEIRKQFIDSVVELSIHPL